MNWTEQEQPECAEQNTMDECYCLDCEWGNDGVCKPWPTSSGRLGREQYQMHKYQEAIIQLSNSNAEECYSFDTDVDIINGTIHFAVFHNDDWGNPVCEEIVLTPSTSGT